MKNLIILIAVLSIFSCNKSETVTPAQTQNKHDIDIIGKWTLTGSDTMEFLSSGNYIYYDQVISGNHRTGRYAFSQKILTIVGDGYPTITDSVSTPKNRTV